jgi:nitrogenase subunit NifH
MNTFSDKILNSVEFLTVYNLKLLCKKLGIKGYSGKRKLWIQTTIRNHLTKQQEKEMIKVKGLFCYPEIIQTIYQYHTVDDVDLKRIDMMKTAKKDMKKVSEFLELLEDTPMRSRKYLCRENNYRNMWHVKDILCQYEVLTRTDFKKFLKKDLKRWLQALHYKPKGGLCKLRKKQLYDLVIKENDILISIR